MASEISKSLDILHGLWVSAKQHISQPLRSQLKDPFKPKAQPVRKTPPDDRLVLPSPEHDERTKDLYSDDEEIRAAAWERLEERDLADYKRVRETMTFVQVKQPQLPLIPPDEAQSDQSCRWQTVVSWLAKAAEALQKMETGDELEMQTKDESPEPADSDWIETVNIPIKLPETISGETTEEKFRWIFRFWVEHKRKENQHDGKLSLWAEDADILEKRSYSGLGNPCLSLWIEDAGQSVDTVLELIDEPSELHEIQQSDRIIISNPIQVAKAIIGIGTAYDEKIAGIIAQFGCIIEVFEWLYDRIHKAQSSKHSIQNGCARLRGQCDKALQLIAELKVQTGMKKQTNPGRGKRMSRDDVKQKLAAYGKSIIGKPEDELAKITLTQIEKKTGLKRATIAASGLWNAIAILKKKYKRPSVGPTSEAIEASYGNDGKGGKTKYHGTRLKTKPSETYEDEERG